MSSSSVVFRISEQARKFLQASERQIIDRCITGRDTIIHTYIGTQTTAPKSVYILPSCQILRKLESICEQHPLVQYTRHCTKVFPVYKKYFQKKFYIKM